MRYVPHVQGEKSLTKNFNIAIVGCGAIAETHLCVLKKLNNDLQRLVDSISRHYLSRIETEKQLNGQFEGKGFPAARTTVSKWL